jgi:hypothetical protein
MATRRPAHRLRALAVVWLAVVSATAAGCGSDDADPSDAGSSGEATQPSAGEAWADDLCTAVGDWRRTLTAAQKSLSNPRELSVADVEGIAHDVGDATTALVTDVQHLDAPDTEAGQEVQDQLSGLGDQLEQQAQVVDDALSGSSGSAAAPVAQLATVTQALATMVADTQAVLTTVSQAASDVDLSQTFSSSAACRDLGVGGQDAG